jgi:hypothetical protein
MGAVLQKIHFLWKERKREGIWLFLNENRFLGNENTKTFRSKLRVLDLIILLVYSVLSQRLIVG